ncbi:hypothetical protein ABQ137_07785 [Xanthomonas sp. WHRI 8393]|uniref:hypothetical protein n=1 Tax=Xanthomonas sp. WHRI 8393 TaxID=3161574 RepID=UPI0032E8B78E
MSCDGGRARALQKTRRSAAFALDASHHPITTKATKTRTSAVMECSSRLAKVAMLSPRFFMHAVNPSTEGSMPPMDPAKPQWHRTRQNSNQETDASHLIKKIHSAKKQAAFAARLGYSSRLVNRLATIQ